MKILWKIETIRVVNLVQFTNLVPTHVDWNQKKFTGPKNPYSESPQDQKVLKNFVG